jgi:hypothetical protein
LRRFVPQKPRFTNHYEPLVPGQTPREKKNYENEAVPKLQFLELLLTPSLFH